MPMTKPDAPVAPVELRLDGGAGDQRITPADPVVKLVGRSPVYVGADATLSQISRTMSDESIGTVLVRGPRGPGGIVSERDLAFALATVATARPLRAGDVMCPDIAFATAAETIGDTARRMLDREVRHIVVTRGDVVIGVVSMRDVLATYSE